MFIGKLSHSGSGLGMVRPMTRRTRSRAPATWLATLALLGLCGCLGEFDTGASGPFGAPVDRRPIVCDPDLVVPGGSAIRRLTPTEYTNTVGDLFPGVTIPTLALVDDERVGGFDNLADGQVVSPLLTEQYYRNAHAIGAAAAAGLDSWAPCSTNDAACAAQIVDHIAVRAQRRPLDDADRSLFTTFVETTRATDGLQAAVALFIEALLQTPQFLFRPELGDPSRAAPTGTTALDAFEVASRLSYFLWRTMPDPVLYEAAQSGVLLSAEGVEQHTRRMLDDPRARASIADLHAQWFQTWRVDEVRLSTEAFPQFTPSARDALRESADRYLEEAFFGVGTFESLYEGRYAFVNDEIAPIFGVAPPGSRDLVRVDLDASQRAGILTQPGWLTHRDHEIEHSPIYRGTFVLEHVLCSPTGAPPPGADMVGAMEPGPGAMTGRERWVTTHSGRCAGCHARIDGVGFLFENYDALGRYRIEDNGLPVDSTGTVIGGGDADGDVANAVEFGERLAQSRRVRECGATHYFRYAMGRAEVREDTCQLRALADALERSGGSLPELVVAIVTSNAFRFRVPAPEAEVLDAP